MKTLLCLLYFLGVFLGGAIADEGRLVDAVVAWVGDEPVMLSQLESSQVHYRAQGLLPEGPSDGEQLRATLEQWIDRRLLVREARRLGLEPPAGVLENRLMRTLESLEEKAGGPVRFEKMLEASGETRASFRNDLRERLEEEWLASRVVAREVVVTPDELTVFAGEREDNGVPVMRYVLGHLFLPERPDAQDVLRAEVENIRNGKAFYDAARLFVERYVGRGAQAGNLGVMVPDELHPDLVQALEGMSEGEVTEPVRTDRGWHVLYLERQTTADQILRARKFEEKWDAMAARLREDCRIEVFEDFFQTEMGK